MGISRARFGLGGVYLVLLNLCKLAQIDPTLVASNFTSTAMPRKRAVSTSSDEPAPEGSLEQQEQEEIEQESRPHTSEGKSGASGARLSKHKRRPSAPSVDASNDGDFSTPLNDEDPLSRSARGHPRTASGFTEVDDRAEKRKRRKSARVSFIAAREESDGEGDGGATGANGEPRGEHGSDNRELNRSVASRPSMRTSRLSNGASLRINAVAPAPPPAISMDVMNSNFEEWMKMATDNVSCQWIKHKASLSLTGLRSLD